MKKIIFSMLLTTNVFAGTMTVKGISNIGQSPDYIELKLSVISKCFKTAEESRKAVEDSSKKLRQLITHEISLDKGDQLVITAGNSQRQDETVTVRNEISGRSEINTLCEKGWRSSRQITAKFSDLNLFESLNPRLLSEIDQIEIDQRVNNKGMVNVKLHPPIPRLMPETIAHMEEQALKESLINASKKFETVKDLCSLVNVSIESISNARSVIRPYRDQTDINDDGLNFALQYVHLAYNITFSFENTTGTCAVSLD